MSLQRKLLAGGFALCVALMAAALWLQRVEGLEPCPLCIFQRGFVIALGVAMLAGALHDRRRQDAAPTAERSRSWRRRGWRWRGATYGSRALPPGAAPECGPGLDYMLEAFPLTEALGMILSGSGECAEVQWTFLSLSIPEWTLALFAAFTVFGLWLGVTRAPARADRIGPP